jgi:hypothetical protein
MDYIASITSDLQRCLLFAPPIYCLDRLHHKNCQIVHRAWASTAVEQGTVLTNLVTVVQQVRHNRIALHPMNGIDQFRKVQFDAALLTQRRARWSAWRPLDASAAHLAANFVQVVRQLSFLNHD